MRKDLLKHGSGKVQHKVFLKQHDYESQIPLTTKLFHRDFCVETLGLFAHNHNMIKATCS